MDAQGQLQGGPSPLAPRGWISKQTIAIIVLAAIVFVSALGAILAISSDKPPAVIVSDILIRGPDDVCGLGVREVSFEGFNASTGQTQAFVFPLPNYNSTSCTVRSVTTNTTGFSVSNAQVPETIPPGSPRADLALSITSPSSSYSGILTLELT